MPSEIPTTEDPNWKLLAQEQTRIMKRMGDALQRIALPVEPPNARVHSRERYWEKAATDRVAIAAKALCK